jgi:biotin carboxyl carrier protein
MPTPPRSDDHPAGEHLDVLERLVVAPAGGIFRPLPACMVAMDEGQVHDGEVVGEVRSGTTRLPVRTPFTGHFMGMLAQVGWRVRAGEPVAWLTTDFI